MTSDTSGPFDAKLRDAFESQYILERELTGGGMSRVFLATERALNRQVVIKVLPPELAAGVNRERFRREIQLAAQLQHPHIVPLYAAGEHGDLLYYTMPFIEGESLKQAIVEHGTKEKNTPFTMRDVVRILHDVSDALAYAHARGVIHRDIKPGNVLRSGSHAVVTDFGVAKAISASMPAVGMTTSGMAIGTPAYMAPEQLAGDPAADHRVDIYAVGLLAYELLSGEAPFNETSPQATLAAQMTRDPVAVERKRPDVPPALAALVTRCLQKMPEKRPQTANELVVELDAMNIGSGDFVPSATRRRIKASMATLVGVGAVTAFVLIAGAVVLSSKGQSGDAKEKPAPKSSADSVAAANAAATKAADAQALQRQQIDSIVRAVEQQMAKKAESKPAAPAAPVTPAVDSAMIAQIRAEAIKDVLDSLQKMRPPEQQRGTRSTQTQLLGGRGGNAFSGMTRAQIDSLVRSAPSMVELANRFPGGGPSAPNAGIPYPAIGTPERTAYDERAANMGPPRRIVIADPPADRQRPELQLSGIVLMDSLRRKLTPVARYVIVNHDSVNAMLQKTRGRDSVMHALGAEVNASIRPLPSRSKDSVSWMMTLYDPSSKSRTQVITVGPMPVAASAAIADSLSKMAIRALWQLDHQPRRADVAPKPDHP